MTTTAGRQIRQNIRGQTFLPPRHSSILLKGANETSLLSFGSLSNPFQIKEAANLNTYFQPVLFQLVGQTARKDAGTDGCDVLDMSQEL